MTTSAPPPPGGTPNTDPRSISSRSDFPASLFPSQVSDSRKRTSGGSGPLGRRSSQICDPSGSCGRTCPACGTEDCTSSTPTLFDWATGTESAGFELVLWAPHTCGPACSEWPTPRASDGERGGRGDLLAKLRTGQTSRRKEWGRGQRAAVRGTGQANPEWIGWLMGFPENWLNSTCAPTATQSSPPVAEHIGRLITATAHQGRTAA